MARTKIKRKGLDWKGVLGEEKEFFKNAIQEVVQEVLDAEMDETAAREKENGQPSGVGALVNKVVSGMD